MTNNMQKVCPVQVREKLDPYYRNTDGYAIGSRTTAPDGICAIVEFLIQVPLHNRNRRPTVESLCITSGGHVLMNGAIVGTLDELQGHLRDWATRMNLDVGYETVSFQAMIDANMGVQGSSGVTI